MARGEIHVELSVNYADDPKVAALARWPKHARGARDLYVQMVCYAKANMTDGYVPAENLGKLVYPDSLKTAEGQAKMLAEVGLIEAAVGGWLIPAYLKRNKSRAEVIELSEARSEAGRKGGMRSGLVRQPEATVKQVAKQVANVLGSVGLNTESETESKSESSSSARKRATRIPAGWKPSDDEIAWQRSHGISDDLARRELPKFLDYWGSKGRDATKTDWPATWRNWLRRAAESTPAAKAAARPDAHLEPWERVN